jgi:hypothetical protein
MASPDFSQYIDLTIDDRDATDVYDSAVEYARIAMPEFTPRVGTIEDSILQACALMASMNLSTINRLPHGLMEGILRLMGFNRYEATFSTVNVEFTLVDSSSSVPNNFFVVYEAVVGNETVQYPFRTTSEITAEPAEAIAYATLVCEVPGVIPTLLPGTDLTIVQPNPSVLACQTLTLINQGNEPETDEEYFNRATSYLASLSSSLVTAEQIEEFIVSNFPDAFRCKVYDLVNPVYDIDKSIVITNVPLKTASVLVSDNFATNSDFTDYTRIINREPGSGGIASVASGLYDTSPSGNEIGFTAEGNVGISPVAADLIDMFRLRHDNTTEYPGFFAIFVCDEEGHPLSSDVKTAIYDAVNERIVAGLSFVVLDALICDIQFSVDVTVDSEYSASGVVASVAEELQYFVSPEAWPQWEKTIRVFDVVVKANSVDGVAYVNSVTPIIPEYGDIAQAMAGNEKAIQEINPGTGVTALQLLYKGSLPRATVEVTVS